MLNSSYYNNIPYNWLSFPLWSPIGFFIKYWDYIFSDDKIVLSNIPDIDNNPNINFQNYNIARTDGMGNSEYTMQNKQIAIRWWIRWSTQSDMEELILEMKRGLYKKNQKLHYKRGDGKEIYTNAYLTNLTFDRNTYTINYVPFTAVFMSLEPFFYDTQTTEYGIVWQTWNFSWSILYSDWTYHSQPIVYISMNTASWVDSITLTIDWKSITLNENIDSNSFVIFDSKNKDVSINGIGWKDYIWSFPSLDIGEKDFSISMNWSRDADIYIQWENTYV